MLCILYFFEIRNLFYLETVFRKMSMLHDLEHRLKNFSIESLRPKAAVFGAAPSLQSMRDLNALTKGKKTLFRGATFWFYFRFYYFQVAPVIWLIFMIVALTAWNTVEGHLVLGSIISLVSSVSVLASYVMVCHFLISLNKNLGT